MSHRSSRVVQLGGGKSYVQKYTDHSEEIAKMNRMVKDWMRRYPADKAEGQIATPFGPLPVFYAAVMLKTAATLLQSHDDTGISLDDWIGPRELVIDALDLAGFDGEDVFLSNHV